MPGIDVFVDTEGNTFGIFEASCNVNGTNTDKPTRLRFH
jgi:hypothetical protein